MKHLQNIRSALLVASLASIPSTAAASDFSALIYFFIGIFAVLALFFGVVAYYLTKGVKSIFFQSLIWGIFLAFFLAPLNTRDGNGTAFPPQALAILMSALDADSAYATGTFKALPILIPACVGIVALFIWGRPKQDGPSDSDDCN